ncbi:MAG: hypothetical protein ACI849_001760, partial [Patiriisocius sp.]
TFWTLCKSLIKTSWGPKMSWAAALQDISTSI